MRLYDLNIILELTVKSKSEHTETTELQER